MAEAAVPTFKLVLVGDGGTGKVRQLFDDDAAATVPGDFHAKVAGCLGI
jgi:GTPase SAR1 family protein